LGETFADFRELREKGKGVRLSVKGGRGETLCRHASLEDGPCLRAKKKEGGGNFAKRERWLLRKGETSTEKDKGTCFGWTLQQNLRRVNATFRVSARMGESAGKGEVYRENGGGEEATSLSAGSTSACYSKDCA